MPNDAANEMAKRLQDVIDMETWHAHEDCARYRDEYESRCQKRMRRLHDELLAPRAQLDQIVRVLAESEMLRPSIVLSADKI